MSRYTQWIDSIKEEKKKKKKKKKKKISDRESKDTNSGGQDDIGKGAEGLEESEVG